MQIHTRRLRVVQWVGIALCVVIVGRLAYWQVWKHGELAAIAERQYTRATVLPTQRGEIRDRQGRIIVGNEERYVLFAEPHVVRESPPALSALLAPLVFSPDLAPPSVASDAAWQLQETQRLQLGIGSALMSGRRWVALAPRLSRAQKERIQALQIHGLGFDPFWQRSYPDASLSAHLLGFLGKDAQGVDRGYFGVEGFYDRELRGREGSWEQQTSAAGLPLLGGSEFRPARPGRSLQLTIDSALQYAVEAELKSGMERYGAKAGEVVIMDPHSGEILALASFPNYDPAQFAKFPSELYRAPAVSELYEPGSTLKVLTVAAGIEAGAITPETACRRCGGPREINGFSIKTWNNQYHPDISMREALAQSDNTAMVFIQEELGKERFLSWLRAFGLNSATGIDMQGEVVPPFRDDGEWRTIDVATTSFGQGIAVTSIGLVRAVAALANGGHLVQPHVVQTVWEGDEAIPVTGARSGPILSESTLAQVRDMMVYAAAQGDARWTAAQDFPVAGKTGTAQIAEGGKYLEDKTLASFIGFAPADNPRFVMLVKLREPTSSPWGSETAAPLWFRILPILRAHFSI